MHEDGLHWMIALAVFVGTYVGLGLGRLPLFRVDRTGVAIIGATAMIATGVIPWDRAVAAVDAHTLVLLFGMMIIAAYLRLSGFFHLVTDLAVRRARTASRLLAMIIVAAGGLSALFVNDVVCLVMAPIVVEVTRQLRLPPVPYLVALATAANVGSVATLTGNPQNMLIGSFSGISYRAFLLRELPVALVGLAVVYGVLRLCYGRQLPAALEVAGLRERFPVHYPLMIKTLLVVLIMLGAFLAGVPIALVAITGAAYTLLTRRVKPEKVYREIDWQLLVLFSGLFVVIRHRLRRLREGRRARDAAHAAPGLADPGLHAALTRGLTRRRHEGTIFAGTRRRRSWGREPVSSSSTGCARPAASFGSATSASTTSRPTRSSPAPRGRWRACSTASTSMPTSA
jgi:Na+/H+ antiporter NhaD/arsenite permease-like protein